VGSAKEPTRPESMRSGQGRSVVDDGDKAMSKSNFGKVSKNLQGATYGNPNQAPYVENDYSQNVPLPNVTGGGPPYDNPYSDLGVVDAHFFSPATPNDPAFSDMQAPNEISVADPIGQIMSDFKAAQQEL
jgi:hypothetical protein